jgi:hypothetical protein
MIIYHTLSYFNLKPINYSRLKIKPLLSFKHNLIILTHGKEKIVLQNRFSAKYMKGTQCKGFFKQMFTNMCVILFILKSRCLLFYLFGCNHIVHFPKHGGMDGTFYFVLGTTRKPLSKKCTHFLFCII